VFFSLPSWALALLIFGVVSGAWLAGVLIGRYLRRHTYTVREPIGVLQGALLGLVGLILAFGFPRGRRSAGSATETLLATLFAIIRPRGASSLPQVNVAPPSPPRAAYSHSASVGSDFPAQAA
jgi:hypothetical protein